MFTVGTAGHVDHGKSTLVKALTGIDPDRLPEEKQREMTIDLGFAWATLPSGEEISIVDVPGHERFIKNMLAGVGGIDLALLVIAADEGVMPQTREHLAILDLLGVDYGLVVLTKRDLVEAEWLELVEDEVRQALAGTTLEAAPMLSVSAVTGEGLPGLLAAVDEALRHVPARRDIARPRLPVDRVFTLAGFGTVVTGTLVDGAFALNEEVEVLPERRRARIRGMQVHRHKVERAEPGSRTAINLSGVALDEVHRGCVISRPRAITPVRAIDVRLRVVADAGRGVSTGDQLDLFAGAAEVLARAMVLEQKELRPGETGWVRLRLAEPLAVAPGDKFIVRLPSPSVTIGGGEIADTAPRLHHRFRQQSLARLEAREGASPEAALLNELQGNRPVAVAVVLGHSGLSPSEATMALGALETAGSVVRLDDALLSAGAWAAASERTLAGVRDFHRRFPLRSGLPKEELKSRLGWAARPFKAAVERWHELGALVDGGAFVAAAGFQVRLSAEAEERVAAALREMNKAPYAPPSESDLGLSADELAWLIAQGDLVRVAENLVFSREAYEALLAGVLEHFHAQPTITLAEFRDRFTTSRKYAQAFLEHLDERKITRRVGDDRVLVQRPKG
ncbi:MAG TPA: selenocysteine-specific translation elongation factor [Chloroflexota bacterium]|nr:selenocysteine-specific translation elongation factor [Chloroflexota bacterium]